MLLLLEHGLQEIRMSKEKAAKSWTHAELQAAEEAREAGGVFIGCTLGAAALRGLRTVFAHPSAAWLARAQAASSWKRFLAVEVAAASSQVRVASRGL